MEATQALDNSARMESTGSIIGPLLHVREAISPSDERIEQGKVVDMLACERAIDQPRQFFATFLDTLLKLLPALIQKGDDKHTAVHAGPRGADGVKCS